MRVEGNLGSGNCRCKVPEIRGNLEHWRNRGKVRVTGTLCERENGGKESWDISWGHVQVRSCLPW